MDLAKLLVVQEESSNASLNNSINSLANAIKNQPKAQNVSAPASTSVTEGKTIAFTKTLENFTNHGTLFTQTYPTTFRLFKFKTPTEFTNLTFTVNNEVYMEGDYAYYNEIGFAYYDYDDSTYVINIESEKFTDGVKITLDKGITIKLYTVIGSYVK